MAGPFKLRSGNSPLFKTMGSSPVKRADIQITDDEGILQSIGSGTDEYSGEEAHKKAELEAAISNINKEKSQDAHVYGTTDEDLAKEKEHGDKTKDVLYTGDDAKAHLRKKAQRYLSEGKSGESDYEWGRKILAGKGYLEQYLKGMGGEIYGSHKIDPASYKKKEDREQDIDNKETEEQTGGLN